MLTYDKYIEKSPGQETEEKVKRRLRKGRVAFALTVLALVVVGIMALLSRCSDDAGSVFRQGGDFRTPVPTALEAGRADAMKALQAPAGSMERDAALLYIKSREYRLRNSGYGHAADDYINAANDLLLTHGVISSH